MSTCVGSFAIVVRDLVGGLGVVLGRWGGGWSLVGCFFLLLGSLVLLHGGVACPRDSASP